MLIGNAARRTLRGGADPLSFPIRKGEDFGHPDLGANREIFRLILVHAEHERITLRRKMRTEGKRDALEIEAGTPLPQRTTFILPHRCCQYWDISAVLNHFAQRADDFQLTVVKASVSVVRSIHRIC